VATLASLGAAALAPAVHIGQRAERRARHTLAGPARLAVLAAVDVTLAGLDSAVTSPLAEEIGERIRASALAEVMEPLVSRAIDSPETERLIGRVIDSRVIDAVVRHLLDTEALWVAVDEIAQSPAVTDAIGRQGVSFADQMAGVVRQRSRNADDRLEQLVRRFAHRSGTVAPQREAPIASDDGASRH
jgi:hypothetical protein